jgi:hypothetical protein
LITAIKILLLNSTSSGECVHAAPGTVSAESVAGAIVAAAAVFIVVGVPAKFSNQQQHSASAAQHIKTKKKK